MTLLTLVAEAAVRATLMAAAVGLTLRAGRRASARLTHLAWASVAAAMLLQPAFVRWAPHAGVPVLPAAPASAPATTLTAGQHAVSETRRAAQTLATVRPPNTLIESSRILTAVYLAGVVVLLGRLAVGMWRARRLLAGASSEGAHWVHPRCAVPLTFGLLAPRVILPADWATWNTDELAAVLAHEREHVRRRDTLVACFTLVNRAVFWFHPLAWWLHRRLSELAEQACDEAVLAHGHDAARYAESLLRFARRAAISGGRVQSIAMAMPGSNLLSRLALIAGHGPPRQVSPTRRFAIGMACMSAVVMGSVALPVAAQRRVVQPRVHLDVTLERPSGAVVAGSPVVAAAPVASAAPRPFSPPRAAELEAPADVPVTEPAAPAVDVVPQEPIRIAGGAMPAPPADVYSADDERQLRETLMGGQSVTGLTLTADTSFRQMNRAEYLVTMSVRIGVAGELDAARGRSARLDFLASITDDFGYTQINVRDAAALPLDPSIASVAATPVVYERSVTLLPGRYVLRFLARDRTSGHMGTVTVPFTVPNLARQQAQ